MPSLRNSLVDLDPARYRKMRPVAPIAHPEPYRPSPAPEPPIAIRQSPVLISSLPAISTNVDGIVRQFYLKNLPTRRIVIPG